MSTKPLSEKQEEHYDRIHSAYRLHYFDESSMAYRERFVYDMLFEGLDLNDKTVADLACASGYNSLAVLRRYPRAATIGFDISAKACGDYRSLVKNEAYEIDLTAGEDAGVKVDVAMIVGGLHHCVSNLAGTFATIAGMVNPGGLLLMYEPNKACFLETVRRIWYRVDPYFNAESEHALDHDEILALASKDFALIDCRYSGGPAYFLILNSLIFRVPSSWKKILSGPLFALESLYDRLPGRTFFPTFIARWQRKSQ
ncbi:MAG: class I SAM-dependent methyltransferase [Chromatiales bacterium]